VSITLLSCTKHHIDVLIQEESGDNLWRLTKFYGNPKIAKRRETGETMETVCAS
jgi:hypothetical protein